jgi:hypothetical protein
MSPQTIAHSASPPSSARAAWAKCIAPGTLSSSVRSPSKCSRKASREIPGRMARFEQRSQAAGFAESSQCRRHLRRRGAGAGDGAGGGRVAQGPHAVRRGLGGSLCRSPALNPLPAEPFDLSQWSRARVNIDYHIVFDANFYSVPYNLVQELVGSPLDDHDSRGVP